MNRCKFIAVLLIIIVFSFSACSRKTLESPDEVARTIAKTIINQDKKAFGRYVVNRDGYIRIMELQLASETPGKEVQRIAQLKSTKNLLQALTSLKSSPHLNPRIHKKMIRINASINRSFDRLIKYAKRDGVDLSKATFGKVVSSSTTSTAEKMPSLVQYDITFSLLASGRKYYVFLDDVAVEAGRFYILDGIKWRGRR